MDHEVAKPVNCGHKRKRSEIIVTHICDTLIGQIGGDLLAHIPPSKYNGNLGIIVQKTFVSKIVFKVREFALSKVQM